MAFAFGCFCYVQAGSCADASAGDSAAGERFVDTPARSQVTTKFDVAESIGTASAEEGTVTGNAAPIARHARGHHAKSAAQNLTDHVQALTKELDLNEKQQAGVRDILIRQRVAIIDLRKGTGLSARDVVAAHQAIVKRTREQIRDLLNAEQRKKFFVDVPQDQLGPAQADVNYWLERTRNPASGGAETPAVGSVPAPGPVQMHGAASTGDAQVSAPTH